MTWFLLVLGGCGDGPERGDRPARWVEPVYLEGADQVLPVATVGEPYSAGIRLTGGEPPYTWQVTDGALPGGLVMSPDGTISGTPAQAGTFVVQVEAQDRAFRSERLQITLEVVLEPVTVRCGDTLSGAFSGSASGVDGPELIDLENVAWLAVELPHDDTTRIELVFTDTTAVSTLYVERPAELLGSWDVDRHYVGYYLNPLYTEMTVQVDAGTQPSLSGFETQELLPLLLVAQSGGAWNMEVVCSDGPIFVQLAQYPTELGQPIAIDYDVYGDNSGVRIFTEDPLPDWVVWDETTGAVSGTAEERGGWEFTIVAETEDGKRREERSLLGVYDVVDVACGQVLPFDTTEGYFDGEFTGYLDPRGYQVFRVPLEGQSPSAIDLRLSDSDATYLGTATPEPAGLVFYGGAERLYVSTYDPAELTLDPRTYPAVGHYLDVGELYLTAGTIGTDTSLSLEVDCRDQPRPALAGLPVLDPLVPVDRPLPALGGSAPYVWEASGLPPGLSVTADGVLEGTTGAVGTYTVELTVEDKLGGRGSDTYTLYVGEDQACAGYAPLACDTSLDGTFTETYTSNANGPESTLVACTVNRGESMGYQVFAEDSTLRVDVADPGRTADDLFGVSGGTYVAYVDYDTSEGVPVDPFSWPDSRDYLDLPVLFAVRAYAPGDWTLDLVCQ